MIYLDWASTAPPIGKILDDSRALAQEFFANPSSVHSAGKAARAQIEQARDVCGRYLDVPPEDIYFTAGGTEANNIVFTSLLNRKFKGSVVVSGIEHPSVYEPARLLEGAGHTVQFIKAESTGIVDPERFAAAVGNDTVLAALMLVNNETGAIEPVKEACRLIRGKESRNSRRLHIHTDAVQAFGKMKISPGDLGVDSLSASGHKIGAPRGAGLLYLSSKLETVFRGGGQENGVRPGTENLQAICGLAKAVEIWETGRDDWIREAWRLRRLILQRISRIPGARLLDSSYVDSTESYLPFIVMASFPPIPGEVLVRVMSDRGFAISTGSACSARGKKNLRVIRNTGADDAFAESAVRISFGPETAASDCEVFCDALEVEARTLAGQIGIG
jgi:cysteine desulfurase